MKHTQEPWKLIQRKDSSNENVSKYVFENDTAVVEELNPNYGVLVVNPNSIRDGVECVRRARPLHRRKPETSDLLDAAKRMASELCSWHLFEHNSAQAHRLAVDEMRELIRAAAAADSFANDDGEDL